MCYSEADEQEVSVAAHRRTTDTGYFFLAVSQKFLGAGSPSRRNDIGCPGSFGNFTFGNPTPPSA